MLFSTTLLILGLSACDSTREALGLKKKPPDEFAVSPYEKGLEVPPHIGELPDPQKKETDQQLAKKEPVAGKDSLTKGEKDFLDKLR